MWIGCKMQAIWKIFIILNIIACVNQCVAFPVTPATTNTTQSIMYQPSTEIRRRPSNIFQPSPVPIGILRPSEQSEGRIFFDTIGNFISTSDYFPLELNVPDTIATVGQGLNDMFSGIMGLMGQAEQVPRMLYRMLRNVVVGRSIWCVWTMKNANIYAENTSWYRVVLFDKCYLLYCGINAICFHFFKLQCVKLIKKIQYDNCYASLPHIYILLHFSKDILYVYSQT